MQRRRLGTSSVQTQLGRSGAAVPREPAHNSFPSSLSRQLVTQSSCMPTVSPSLLLQLCPLCSSKQKVFSFMLKWGHLIRKHSEICISFSLESAGSRTAPLRSCLDAKLLGLKPFSSFPCSPSSLLPDSQLVWRQIPACLLDPDQKLSWGLAFTIWPGGSFAARDRPTRPTPIHQVQAPANPNESLRSRYLNGKLACATLRSPRRVLCLGAWCFHSHPGTHLPLCLSLGAPQSSTHPGFHCRELQSYVEGKYCLRVQKLYF